MRKVCANWWIWAIVMGAGLAAATPAQAFYWYDWPGSGVPPHHVIVGPPHGGSSGGKPPTHPGNPGTPSTPPSGPSTPPRVPTGPPSDQTNPTPEPATGVIALAGAGILAAGRTLRKRMK